MDVFFLLIGAAMVLAMHAGFAFLEAGTVRRKNQVNALSKILCDLGVSTIAYFAVGYSVAYGVSFFASAEALTGAVEGAGFGAQGVDLVRFFFLLMFAAAIPAIISGGIAERARFVPQLIATAVLVGLVYPFFEGIVWGGSFGLQDLLKEAFGAPFHDFAGSVVVHGVGGWLALGAVVLLGVRRDRYAAGGQLIAIPPSNIPYLALGSWILCVGWFGFNVMSSQSVATASGLVALNSVMAMAGGLLVATVVGRNDPGFTHNGALAGLVAVCAGSDVMHPLGALVTGGAAGALFIWGFNKCQRTWKIDDVLGVWPLHGLCGILGGVLAGVFGQTALGGLGGVSLAAQVIGSAAGLVYAGVMGFAVYGVLKATIGIRLSPEDEFRGADIAIHKVPAYPEEELIH
ncbi:ammonium transporter [Novispirillum sp. DQ9]|uniref:ammonium transporter n=1 Tax=Novispirillum sp. DQ9 TaxID=3398612 RepID=UPI003C7DA4D1